MKSFAMEETIEKPPFFEMGQRIIKARETLTDKNQSEMTKALDLREPTYGNYERGHRKMPPHVMEKFSSLTGCLSDYIYLGKGPMTKDGAPWEQKFIEGLRQLDEAGRNAFEGMLKSWPKK